MIDTRSAADQRPQRLTTLIYNDPSPYLQLPRPTVPPYSAVEFCPAADRTLAVQDAGFEQAAGLLLATDLSYIEARQPIQLPQCSPAQGSMHAQFLAKHPGLFDCSDVRVATECVSLLQQQEQQRFSDSQQNDVSLTNAIQRPRQVDTQSVDASGNVSLSASHSAGGSSAAKVSISVPTKRKRSYRRPRKAVVPPQGSGDAAESCTVAILNWLPEFATEDVEKQETVRRLPQQLRDVSYAFGNARAACAFKDVDPALLRKAVGGLSAVMRAAEIQIVTPAEESSEETDETNVAMLAAAGVDACVAAFHVAAEPGLPRHLLPEETLQQAANVLRIQLQQNVFPFFCPRLQRLLRPGLSNNSTAVQANGAKRAKVMTSSGPCLRAPEGVNHILKRLEAALGVLPAMIANGGCIPSDSLLRLMRALSQALTVATLDVLHVQAAGALVAIFCQSPQHRSLILQETTSAVMPYIYVPKPASRTAPSSGMRSIHVVTQMFLQMVQGVVQLPPVGASAKVLQGCFTPAVVAAEQFWTLQLERLNNEGAGKGERDAGTKAWIEQSVADVLAVLNCLEWPAASLALNRLISLLRTKPLFGIASPNLVLRQMYVELLGTLTAALHSDSEQSDADMLWIKSLNTDPGDTGTDGKTQQLPNGDLCSVVHRLALQHLGVEVQAGSLPASSAVNFIVARSISEQAQVLLAGSGTTSEDSTVVLSSIRGEATDAMVGQTIDLAPEETLRLGRFQVQHSALGRIRARPLTWLLDCVDQTQQAAVVRCKAVKALSTIVHSSPRVLTQPVVMQALSHALQDSAKVVREAAIELLGRHVGADSSTAAEYFEHLVAATRDAGVGVRKRALQILWDSCIRLPGFPRATDACVAILRCCCDSEESVRQLVSRVFLDLWFSPGSGGSASGIAAKAARQLRQVAMACYCTNDVIQFPLDPRSHLVSLLATALRTDAARKTSPGTIGPQLAAALLEDYLSIQEAPSDDNASAGYSDDVACLLALHALALADASVCVPQKDPSLFVRSLSPYLKTESVDQSSSQTHCLLAVLAILSSVVPRLEHLNPDIEKEMVRDLWTLAGRQLRPLVSAAACSTFAHLAKLSPEIAGRSLVQLVSKYITILGGQAPALDQGYLQCWASSDVAPEMLSAARGNAPRALYVVGQLWHHGCESLEAAQQEEENADEMSPPVPSNISLHRCLDIMFAFYHLPSGEIALQDAALQALGQLFIARPGLMLLDRSEAVTKSALLPAAPLVLKHRVLRNLTDLLKAEQSKQAATGDAFVADSPGLHAPRGAGTDVDHESAAAIAAHNGEGDSVGVRSGVLQANWDSILRLATEVGSQAGDASKAALVRRRAFEVIDAVCRAGLVPPWEPVPALVVLSTDSQPDVAKGALVLLTRQSKLPGCTAGEFQGYLAMGVPLAHQFHMRMAAISAAGGAQPGSAPAAALQSGVMPIYSCFVQPTKGAPATFLSALLRRFDSAATVALSRPQPTDIRLLSTCAQLLAALPFRTADEPLAALASLSAIIARRGDAAVDALRTALHQLPDNFQPDGDMASQKADVVSPAGNGQEKAAASIAKPTDGGNHTPGCATPRVVGTDQVPLGLDAVCSAALSVSMLLMLKKFLLTAYGLLPQRVALYAAGNAERRKTEEKTAATCDRTVRHNLEQLRLDCASDADLAAAHCRILRFQMKEDAAMYIGSLGASEEGTPGGQTARRTATTAARAGGGRTARMKGHAATTGGRRRTQHLARMDAEDACIDNTQQAGFTPDAVPARRRLRL